MTMLPDKHTQRLNPDGKAYEVLTDVEVAKQQMLAGYTLRECADGWCQVFTVTGVKHFYRISPEIIENIKDKLKAI